MGDRVSISFSNVASWDGKTREVSPVLFSHWGGMDFVNFAYAYARELKSRPHEGVAYPLDRMEPGTVMVDFIRELAKGRERVESNYYLGRTDEDGDNSDNGHHEIRLDQL